MTGVIHQAYFGCRNDAHALLATSSPDRAIFEALTHHTDRSGTPPPALVWEPFLSGFPFRENYYVFARTFPDPAAPRRGMVFTHALLLDLKDAAHLKELDPLLNRLVHAPIQAITPPPISLSELGQVPETRSPPGSTFPGRAAEAVRLLLERHRNSPPLVWIGQEHFEALVTLLWRNLWPEARRALRFRLSFDPSDVEGYGFTLVAAPAALPNRWHGFPSVAPDANHQPKTRAEAALLGLSEGEPLRDFLTQLGGAPPYIYVLKRIEQASETLRSLATADVNAVLTLTRILAADTPDPSSGVLLKQRTLERLAELLQTATAEEILSVRNLKPEPFPDRLARVAEVFSRWMRTQVHAPQGTSGTARILAQAFSEQPTWWRRAILRAVEEVLRDWDTSVARTLWDWWQAHPSLVNSLESLLPETRSVERELIATTPPTLEPSSAEALLHLTRRRGWLALHAAIASARYPAREAIRAHLEVDTSPGHWDGIRVLAERLAPDQFVSGALDTGNERLLQLAGERAAAHPELLVGFEVRNPRWRQLWLHAIRAGGAPWSGISDPISVRSSLLDILLNGTPIASELLTRIATTPQGDLLDYPRRAEVWKVLPEEAASAFLRTTAEAWLRRFQADPAAVSHPERPLEERILQNPQLLPTGFSTNVAGFLQGLEVFERFTSLGEQRFRDWLRAATWRMPTIKVADASRLGRLVAARNWHSAASELLSLEVGQPALTPALQECAFLLRGIDRLRLFFRGGSPSRGAAREMSVSQDWWAVLREFVLENFPTGPMEHHLWERAGGDPSVLWGLSGRERWDAALKLLREGGGGKHLTVRRLLKEMREERENNEKLHLLIQSQDELSTPPRGRE